MDKKNRLAFRFDHYWSSLLDHQSFKNTFFPSCPPSYKDPCFLHAYILMVWALTWTYIATSLLKTIIIITISY